MKSTIEQLAAEELKLRARRKKVIDERNCIEDRLNQIENERHRLTLAGAIGQAVQIRYRLPASDRCAKLNDAAGTLVKVNRSRALVDFGEHGRWNWQIDELRLANSKEPQGFVMQLGASR